LTAWSLADANAVMNRHPELKTLPGYLSEMVGGDFIDNVQSPDGSGDLTVIIVVIDDTDPNTGAATLAKAKEQLLLV
jgi:hypothetical protein